MRPINIFTWAFGGSCRGTIYRAPTVARSPEISPAARKRLGTKLFARFGFEALVMNRTGSLIGRGDLPGDLFAERHAGHKMRRAPRRMNGRGLPRPGRHKDRPNTGEPSAGDQSIARGVGGIIALDFANIFAAAIVAYELRNAFDQLGAIFGDDPGVRFHHLVHQLPSADAVVISRSGTW